MRVCCKLETAKCLGDRFTYGFLTNQLFLHDKLVPINVLIKEKVGRRMDIVSFTSRCQRCPPMPHIFCHSHFAILAPGSSKTSDQNDKHYNTCNLFFLTE